MRRWGDSRLFPDNCRKQGLSPSISQCDDPWFTAAFTSSPHSQAATENKLRLRRYTISADGAQNWPVKLNFRGYLSESAGNGLITEIQRYFPKPKVEPDRVVFKGVKIRVRNSGNGKRGRNYFMRLFPVRDFGAGILFRDRKIINSPEISPLSGLPRFVLAVV